MKDKSILLVEDNVKLANYLKESLQEAGYDVNTANLITPPPEFPSI